MAAKVRIVGLVGLAERVRRELAGLIGARERSALRQRVEDALENVSQIVAEAGSRPDRLPLPSRRALQFLKSINWDKVEIGDAAPHEPAPSHIRWIGLSRFVERAMDRVGEPLTDAEAHAVRESIARTSRQIEGMIERKKLGPKQIAPSARQLRGWLAMFSQADDLAAYLAAQALARQHLVIPDDMTARFPPPVLVRFRPMRGIFKLGRRGGQSVLSLPTGSITFIARDFTDLAAMIFRGDRHARQRVIERMTSEGFQSVQAELEALSGIVEQARGAFHDLDASFSRVNATYFDGAMPRPRLTWSRSFTGRKFGHYDWILDTVMLSRTLDAQDVPSFLVDFIMYHELLHKQHGLRWVNGRGYAHTPQFQRDERKFERFEEAEAALERLARRVAR